MLAQFTARVMEQGAPLEEAEVGAIVRELTDEQVSAQDKAKFLMAFARRGETPREIAAFVRELRALSIRPQVNQKLRDGEILDVVGTGGDRLNTFNISSTAALLIAAAGVKVAKHGNRAVTSQSGSADMIEALGIRIELEPEEVGPWLEEHGFAYLYAPKYHPAFRHIAPARKICAEAGQRTLFNFLGPLLNPVGPSAQLMGVTRPELCEPMALVLKELGVRRAMVVCGEASGGAFLDELSVLGSSVIAEFYQEKALSQSTLDLALFPVRAAQLEDLRGGDRVANARRARRILAGEEDGPCCDATLLTASAGLWLGGAAESLVSGWELAVQTIASGRALRYLERLTAVSLPRAGR